MQPVRYWLKPLAVDEDRLRALHALLAPEENAHAHRFRFVPDRNRFVARRGLRREILGELTGLAPHRLVFVEDVDGKPRLEDGPAFNASSSGDWMLLAVAEAEVGCDIEAVEDGFDWSAVARAEYAPAEQAMLVGADDFFRVWTRKEACAKAVGTGLLAPLAGFSTAEASAVLGGRRLEIADLPCPAGYRAAVAVACDQAPTPQPS